MVVFDCILGRLRQGDLGTGGGTVDGVTEVGPVTVPPGGPSVVDAVDPTAVCAVKWFVCIESGALRQVTEVYASLGATPVGNNNNTLGDTIDYVLGLTAVGPNVVLTVTNNTGANLTFKALRLTI